MMIMRIIIAMHVHFRVFFCSLLAFWRAPIPDWIWSSAFVTCMQRKKITNTEFSKSIHICTKNSYFLSPLTCASMLSSMSPWASINTAMSRKIYTKKGDETPAHRPNATRIKWSYLLQVSKLLFDLPHSVMTLLDFCQGFDYLKPKNDFMIYKNADY